jgi:hypothetical protein
MSYSSGETALRPPSAAATPPRRSTSAELASLRLQLSRTREELDKIKINTPISNSKMLAGGWSSVLSSGTSVAMPPRAEPYRWSSLGTSVDLSMRSGVLNGHSSSRPHQQPPPQQQQQQQHNGDSIATRTIFSGQTSVTATSSRNAGAGVAAAAPTAAAAAGSEHNTNSISSGASDLDVMSAFRKDGHKSKLMTDEASAIAVQLIEEVQFKQCAQTVTDASRLYWFFW